MKYEEAKKLIRNGDVLTFSGSWFFSRMIRWWTKQTVSHVGLAVWLRFGIETEDRLCILESLEPYGVRIVPLSLLMPEYLAGGNKVFWQSYICGNGDEVLGHAMSNWGSKYANWFQFLAFVSPSFRRLRTRFHGTLKVGDGFTCSELVARAFNASGMDVQKPAPMMTPGDFHYCQFLGKPEELR